MEEVARAEQAERILRTPLWQEVWAAMESDLLQAWRTSRVAEKQEREEIWLALQVIGKVKKKIEDVIVTGRMAADELRGTQQ